MICVVEALPNCRSTRLQRFCSGPFPLEGAAGLRDRLRRDAGFGRAFELVLIDRAH